MSAYVRVSKEIGWDAKKMVAPPPLGEIQQLLEKARLGDEAAFRRIFECYRFCGLAENDVELQQINALAEAFFELAPKFREIP